MRGKSVAEVMASEKYPFVAALTDVEAEFNASYTCPNHCARQLNRNPSDGPQNPWPYQYSPQNSSGRGGVGGHLKQERYRSPNLWSFVLSAKWGGSRANDQAPA
jgi:hypothetical protein